MRKVSAALASIGLLGSLFLAIGQAPAASASSPSARSLIGLVTRASGPASGTRVVLWAWPTSKVLMKLKPGQRVPAKIVGTAVTSASGSYAMRLVPSVALRHLAQNGSVNYTLIAMAPGQFASFSYHSPVGAAVAALTLRLTAARHTTVLRVPGCGWVFIKSYGAHWAIVGGTYSITNRVSRNFTYSSGQSSSLGVGASSSGSSGSFSETGTANVSSDTSEGYPTGWGRNSTRYESEFIHGKYGYTCGSGWISFQARPTGYAGGALTSATSAPRARTYCVYQAAGSTFTKHTTAAFIFAAGVTIPVINLSLSSQTGYDTSAELSYHFGIAHYLCGTNGYPGGSPKRVIAGRPS